MNTTYYEPGGPVFSMEPVVWIHSSSNSRFSIFSIRLGRAECRTFVALLSTGIMPPETLI